MSDSSVDVGREFQPKPPDGEFSIRKIYCKDISFETPNSPAMFQKEWQPDAEVHMRTDAKKLAAGEYEVTLVVTVTVNVGDDTAFLAEVQYAGIFGITGLTSDEMGPTLGSFCPSILFPYTREVVSDLVTRGGFPQFILAPVNFEALYAKSLVEQTDEQLASGRRL
ncbi:MAG: protein-export chaperone SecB [Gammaproteobacteria bacterium]|nr:protein-export chaperone SecB [Gammaproteobacteria bacterium]